MFFNSQQLIFHLVVFKEDNTNPPNILENKNTGNVPYYSLSC